LPLDNQVAAMQGSVVVAAHHFAPDGRSHILPSFRRLPTHVGVDPIRLLLHIALRHLLLGRSRVAQQLPRHRSSS
jgi:hypothetical protein